MDSNGTRDGSLGLESRGRVVELQFSGLTNPVRGETLFDCCCFHGFLEVFAGSFCAFEVTGVFGIVCGEL